MCDDNRSGQVIDSLFPVEGGEWMDSLVVRDAEREREKLLLWCFLRHQERGKITKKKSKKNQEIRFNKKKYWKNGDFPVTFGLFPYQVVL